MTDEELLREAALLWEDKPRPSDLRASPGRNPRWTAGELAGKATEDLLPELASVFGVKIDALREWIDLAKKVEPELREHCSWAAFRALTKRPDWRRLVKPGLSERQARRLAGGNVSNLSPKERADRIEKWWRDKKVRDELRGRERLARTLRTQLDRVEDEDRRRLRELQRNAMVSKKAKTPDAAIDDLMVKLTRTTLELETALSLIKDGQIVIYERRRKELEETFTRLENVGYEGANFIEETPPPPDDDIIDIT